MGGTGNRGGRYGSNELGRGDFGRDVAGERHTLTKKDWGTRHEFVGSGAREYTFYSETLGTLTISANSYWDALRIARSRGYSRKHHRKYRRK